MTDKPIVFVAISPDLIAQTGLERFFPQWEESARVERWQGPANPPADLVAEAAGRAEVMVTGWGTPSLIEPLRGWALETSPLRLVVHTAGSVKFLLPGEALERGLLVSHANDSLAEAVAEFTIGAILGMRRQIFLSAQRYKAHQPAPAYTSMRELPGSVVGIIGASAIGRRVMEWLRPWQVKILLFDPYVSAAQAAQWGAEPVSLLDLCRLSDIVSLHAPITPETVGMLGAEHFSAMKTGALFVNTARGVLVDHAALLAELQTGRFSALLDVTDPTEPLPPDSPFFALENCVLVPHQAGNSLEARLRQGKYAGEDVLAYLEHRSLSHRVPPEKWRTMA
ncbi:MAG: hydroxyacid dehydrogenase [Chloroflexi bacterium]|nr:MAG: hydroxyacid dehydrogenase [Chloroflexota bacterium]